MLSQRKSVFPTTATFVDNGQQFIGTQKNFSKIKKLTWFLNL